MSDKRKSELEEKLKSLLNVPGCFFKAFGVNTRIINGHKHTIPKSEQIDSWDRENLDNFEKKILKLEEAKKELEEKEKREKPLIDRQRAYSEIDHLLLEALAEKENGRPEKMQECLKLRKEIKDKYPKV